MSGAAAVSGSSRSVWMFSRDPEDKSLYHMTNVKGNLAKKKTGLDYTIEDREAIIQPQKGNLRRLRNSLSMWKSV